MISVGIDVSKGKSTVCVLKPYGEIVCKPFEMFIQEAISVLRTVDRSLFLILSRMQALAKSLPEYLTVREMSGSRV